MEVWPCGVTQSSRGGAVVGTLVVGEPVGLVGERVGEPVGLVGFRVGERERSQDSPFALERVGERVGFTRTFPE